MSYIVQIQGGYGKGSGSATEQHHVKEALANLYQELEERGHSLTTAFINDVPHNFQLADERNKARGEAEEHYDLVEGYRREAAHEPEPVAVPLSSTGEAPPTLTTPQTPGKAPEPADNVTAGGPFNAGESGPLPPKSNEGGENANKPVPSPSKPPEAPAPGGGKA